jgi:hypothetical protein
MSKDKRTFDGELISIFLSGIKTAKQNKKTFIIRNSLFDIRYSKNDEHRLPLQVGIFA